MVDGIGNDDDFDEARLFESLCELEPEAQAQRLRALDQTHPALASRLRRLLSIDEAYGTHTARSVMTTEISGPVGDISDIGAFRLVHQIGRGGMGVVYLGERRSDFAQQVAIKIMPRFAIDAQSRERFAQERRILAQLRHPNICTIVDGGELADGTPWLAMEYVPGESLCAWCERNSSSLRERIALFLQLCDAVQYAHRNLVIHRDLKDSNVMIEQGGDERAAVKLLDFGIAKSLAAMADSGHTAVQDRFLSPMTAAPEQLRGERATVSVDVYALGALLHQLLCGVLPFARPQRDPIELQRAILDTVPPRMSDALQRERTATASSPGTAQPVVAVQALRGELDAIVAHCLRKDASERYAEVGDLARDLRAWLSGHPISISGNHRLYRLRKFVRRNRVGVSFAALAVCSVLIALAVTLWQAAALRTERDAAQAARARSDIDRDRARAVAEFVRSTFEEADPWMVNRMSRRNWRCCWPKATQAWGWCRTAMRSIASMRPRSIPSPPPTRKYAGARVCCACPIESFWTRMVRNWTPHCRRCNHSQPRPKRMYSWLGNRSVCSCAAPNSSAPRACWKTPGGAIRRRSTKHRSCSCGSIWAMRCSTPSAVPMRGGSARPSTGRRCAIRIPPCRSVHCGCWCASWTNAAATAMR
jgi:serine/threonine protein kinase